MSSMRNAVHRRSHRERAQPEERKRLGLLEKHKDYSLRAKDYNKKKEQLKSLRQKAADRNEDEFYFGMLSRRGPGSTLTRTRKSFTGAVDGDRGNKAMDMDTVRLLKTQDVGYLRTVRNVVAKEVRELEEREDDEDSEDEAPAKRKTGAKKIVFLEDEAEREQILEEKEEEDDDEDEEMDDDDDDEADEKADRKARHLEKLRKRLQNARRKLKALDNAEHELEIQRAKMAKTATYGGITKSGKKIKIRERKR
ncbi:U3 small nucleolar RNA-associated protein 11 [Coniochaeta ligniaria NRRL 30616]|uniref:U3 small nucleolar RNA-associated protein 11 n=1 Tax=Coniochaeta ligniaria NRRL 30616 TaxID=1408157 RepID=A0A1J7I3I9_9PEZI|nr:U3 small nucleolar RNA-associated protein 11 [Coniochaeta ligniaria NRRL 30616]